MRFFRQYSIGPYILDFYCPTVKLAVELDVGQNDQNDNEEYNATRSEYLKAQGIDVMCFGTMKCWMKYRAFCPKLH